MIPTERLNELLDRYGSMTIGETMDRMEKAEATVTEQAAELDKRDAAIGQQAEMIKGLYRRMERFNEALKERDEWKARAEAAEAELARVRQGIEGFIHTCTMLHDLTCPANRTPPGPCDCFVDDHGEFIESELREILEPALLTPNPAEARNE